MSHVIFETGTVSDIDETHARVRVRLPGRGNLHTWWLDVLQCNTQNNKDYWLPDIGEQVRLLLDEYAEDGVVLGSTYSSQDRPSISDRNRRRADFADGAWIEYDRKNSALAIGGAIKTLSIHTHSDITVQTDTQVTVIAKESATVRTRHATVDSPETDITGNATVKGNLLVEGGITGQGGMTISGAKGGPAATITGTLQASGDIRSAAVSLENHAHYNGNNGGPTGSSIK